MAKKMFLTQKQMVELSQKEWTPIPNCCWLAIFPEDGDLLQDALDITKADFDVDEVSEIRLCVVAYAVK